MGGALTAIAPDFTRAALGVAGDALLGPAAALDRLRPVRARSSTPYPDQLSRPLLLSLIQMLWDRGEPNGYAHRMTDRPAARHAGAQGPDERRLRRSPGDELAPTSRRARSAPARTTRCSTRAAGPTSTCSGTSRGSQPTRSRAPRSSTPTSARCAPTPTTRRETIGIPPPPLRNVPNRVGEDPHGAPRGIPDGPRRGLELPPGRRRDAQPLRARSPATAAAGPGL